MKKYLVLMFCLALIIANVAYADTITVTADDLIGTIEPGTPAGETAETDYANFLITWYNTDPTTPATTTDGGQTYTLDPGSNVPGSPLQAAVFGDKDEEGPFTVDGPYEYMLVKYGAGGTGEQYSELYYLNGQMGEIVGLNESLSHITLFNLISVPEPSLILLLGLGLGAVSVASRRFKR